MFWVSFGIFMVTTVIYTLWASGEIQPWNDADKYYADKEAAKAAKTKKKQAKE